MTVPSILAAALGAFIVAMIIIGCLAEWAISHLRGIKSNVRESNHPSLHRHQHKAHRPNTLPAPQRIGLSDSTDTQRSIREMVSREIHQSTSRAKEDEIERLRRLVH